MVAAQETDVQPSLERGKESRFRHRERGTHDHASAHGSVTTEPLTPAAGKVTSFFSEELRASPTHERLRLPISDDAENKQEKAVGGNGLTRRDQTRGELFP